MKLWNTTSILKKSALVTKYPSICSCRLLSNDIWKKKVDVKLYKETENYWKKKFAEQSYFDKTKLDEKFYVLSMFPYPSGNLHMGHVRVYTISDALALYHRMNGKNVFQPMGWDAFGLPAENAAFERQIAPNVWTKQNIEHMKKQLREFSFSFDWDHEINTSDPEYYRWTQYIFLKMYEAGLVYRREALVNWDPVDETVLADEQVDENGYSWRSGVKVEKRILNQWFIRTTKFAKDLYDGLNDVDQDTWDGIPEFQRNWIGKCNGYSFDLILHPKMEKYISVWVEDPLVLLNAEFIVIKPDSYICSLLDDQSSENIEAKNPFNNRTLPIYVYNEGMTSKIDFPIERDTYLGAPSINESDKQFAEEVNHSSSKVSNDSLNVRQILEKAENLRIGGYPVSSKLKDWLISRQRYWGTPIPLIQCPKCGPQPVPLEDLPVTLPPIPKDRQINKNLNKLLWESDWRNTSCPKCGGKAVRETDTMDTFVDSCWYFLRYVDHKNDVGPFDSDIANKMLPVDIYVGGKEHAHLHLYYARFISYFLHSIGLTNFREPFTNLLCQGKVRNKTYKNSRGRYFKPEEIEFKGNKVFSKDSNEELTCTWEKMGKSSYNGIEPSIVIGQYGIDTTRIFLLHEYSPIESMDWDTKKFAIIQKWQYRMWLTITDFLRVRSNPLKGPQPVINMQEEELVLRKARNSSLGEITHHYEKTRNFASISYALLNQTMILRKPAREVRKYSKEYEKSLATFLITLAPLAPHFASTLWQGFVSAPDRICGVDEINWDENMLKQKWPKVDPDYMLPVYCRFGDGKLYEIGHVMNQHLSEFSLEDALNLVQTNHRYQKLSPFKLLKLVGLRKHQEYNATLHFDIIKSEKRTDYE
ncbi:leucine--tRNA ligase, mitochondrial-like [Planococcus citri]|uniref:leucine--tRNA ligase, mitochondrial-like n=1 Tax=Planococcus citri TaxID=170843 RepID=UPI0031F7E3F8